LHSDFSLVAFDASSGSGGSVFVLAYSRSAAENNSAGVSGGSGGRKGVKAFRWVLFSIVSLLFVATTTCWALSYFRIGGVLYAWGGDSGIGFIFGNGRMVVMTGTGSITPEFDFIWEELDSAGKQWLEDRAPWGFGSDLAYGVRMIIFPLWLPAILLAGAGAFLFWRIRTARRELTAPAFPVDMAGAKS
jgi:hypothetical protein